MAADTTLRCTGHISTWPSGFGTFSAGRAECVRCVRRTTPITTSPTPLMTPPALIEGKCPQRIDPEEKQYG